MNQVVEIAEIDADVRVYGNIAVRKIVFVGRQVLPAHEHNFAHAHMVVRGAIRCTLHFKGGKRFVADYPAGSLFEVPAEVGHQLESISDDGAEGWCLFAVRNEDADVAYQVTDEHRKDRFWHERKGAGA